MEDILEEGAVSPGRKEEQRERLAQLLGRGEDITREDIEEIEDELPADQQKWIDFQTALLVAPEQCVRYSRGNSKAIIWPCLQPPPPSQGPDSPNR